MEEAKRLMVAYMPYKVHVHRIWTDLSQPWVIGYHRNVFVREFWKYVDVDMDERAQEEQASEAAHATPCAARRAGRAGLARAGRTRQTPRRRRRTQGAALAVPARRDQLRPGAHLRPLLARRHAHIFEALYGYDHLARPAKVRAAHGRRHARGVGRLPRLDRAASGPASTSPTTRPSRASGASWSRRTMSTRSSACRSGQHQPDRRPRRRRASRSGPGCARARRRSRTRSRSTTTRRSKACARSTATRCASSWRSRGRASSTRWPHPTCSARRRARWWSTTATRSASIRWAPGRSGSKSWRRSSRIVLERNPTYREVLYDAEPAADDAEGQAILATFKGRRLPMVDEVDVSVIEEVQPQLAELPEQQVDALATATGQCRASSPTRPCRAASWRPTSPSRACGMYANLALGQRVHLLQHARSDGRRQHAGEGGAAPRDQPGLRRRARDPRDPARPGDAGAVADHAAHHRLRPALQDRDERLRPGARAGAARHCSASSTATATAGASGPTARRWCW